MSVSDTVIYQIDSSPVKFSRSISLSESSKTGLVGSRVNDLWVKWGHGPQNFGSGRVIESILLTQFHLARIEHG